MPEVGWADVAVLLKRNGKPKRPTARERWYGIGCEGWACTQCGRHSHEIEKIGCGRPKDSVCRNA
jgi:hypothetical protein